MERLANETPLRIGQRMRNFELEAYNPAEEKFETVSLQKILNAGKWVVLFFYPGDFTFVCPTELSDLADKHKELSALGAEVVSVSTDSKYSHLSWRKTERMIENVRFLMASDRSGNLARLLGAYDPDTGTAMRGTFIISPDGELAGSEINLYNVGRNAEELVRKLQAYAHLRENPNEACPARWKAGEKTLIPDEEHVGNVYDLFCADC